MAMKVDRIGNFRGTIDDYGLDKAKDTKSMFVRLKCKIEEFWNGETWEDWREYDMEAFGSVCIIKRDGAFNERQVDALLNFAGWNGDFTAITQKTWTPTPIRFSVKEDVYNNKTTGQEQRGFKVDWIDDYDTTPTGGNIQGSVDDAEAKTLNAQLGGSLRARKSNGNRTATKPPTTGSKPPSPSRRQAANAAATNLQAPAGLPPADDIPF